MNDKIKTKIKNIIESKTFHTVIYTLGILFVLFLVFQAGMTAGFRKASFGCDWGKNYAKNFGSPHMGPRIKIVGENFGNFNNLPNAHGAIGRIIKIESSSIIVFDEKDNTEKVIIINDKTEIRNMRDSITKDQLKIDDNVVIIGVPNSSGQIEAKLIRFLPAPFEMSARVR